MIAQELNQCLVTGKVPAWMVEGRTVLIQKDLKKNAMRWETTDQLLALTCCGSSLPQ